MSDNPQDWSLSEATQASLREHMAEIRKLRTLLHDEYYRHSLVPPWKCDNDGCPCFGTSMSRHCKCFRERKAVHVALVREAIKKGGA